MRAPATPVRSSFGPGASRVEADWPPVSAPLPRTSFRVESGRPAHGEAHLARLQEGADRLGWDATWLPEAWCRMLEWLQAWAACACRVRLHSDSLAAQAESLPEPAHPYLLRPAPHPLGDLRQQGLAACKGLLGPWDLEIRRWASEAGASDALLHWPDGTLAETAIAACGLLQGGELRMPPREGRVRSIAEVLDLPAWAASRGWTLAFGAIPLAELDRGEIWCMNAVRGLWQAEKMKP